MRNRHRKKKHGRCQTTGERIERKVLKADHPGSVWRDNELVEEYAKQRSYDAPRCIPGVPSGKMIRQKHEPDWKKGYTLKTNPGRRKAKRRNKQSRIQGSRKGSSSTRSFGSSFNPRW